MAVRPRKHSQSTTPIQEVLSLPRPYRKYSQSATPTWLTRVWTGVAGQAEAGGDADRRLQLGAVGPAGKALQVWGTRSRNSARTGTKH